MSKRALASIASAILNMPRKKMSQLPDFSGLPLPADRVSSLRNAGVPWEMASRIGISPKHYVLFLRCVDRT